MAIVDKLEGGQKTIQLTNLESRKKPEDINENGIESRDVDA